MTAPSNRKGFLLLIAILGGVLIVLFHRSFEAGQALFSNDGPLGTILSRPLAMPQAFVGIWNDNYWVGGYNGNLTPNFSGLIHWVFQGIGRVNFYAPSTVLILGMCAWVFFRRLGCNTRTAILASLAAALNMNYFSNVCWGLGTRALCLGAAFLALAAVETSFVVQPILTSILAGLAIGLSITEGGDNGAILAAFIGTYALWKSIVVATSPGKGVAAGVGKGIVMVIFAAIMASQTLSIFVRTSVKGVVGTAQDTQTKGQKWDFATQWSLPPLETLRVIIPGAFGYRMDTPDGGQYWGRVGEAPSAPQQMPRYSGAGEYTGVLVVLIALWAVVEALRKKGQVFTSAERKLIWFWAVMGIVAVLLSWGRFAPFYKLVYALPYFSTIRNPMKFMHAFNLCAMILFAYGLIGLNRRYLEGADKNTSLFDQLKAWWSKGPANEKLWTWGCIGLVALSAVGWLGVTGSRAELVKHLMNTGFPDQAAAAEIARFCGREVLLYVVFLAASVAMVTFILSGAFSGSRAKWATVLLGTVLVVDLARANVPWIIYQDWKDKYATNPINDILKEKPYEHRVTMPPFQVNQQFSMLQQIYHVEWLQHHFPYYGVQSIDIPQEPRVPADKQAYRDALSRNLGRLWQLTNTRYLFGLTGQFADMLNAQLDPVQRRFRQAAAFTLFEKNPVTHSIGAETNANGPFALIEFTGALPRAKLYTNWEIIPSETNLLARLGDTNWNPEATVLISDADAPKPAAPTAAPGKAEIVANTSTRHMEIKTTSDAPAMLLLNDKIEPEWHAYIDGKPAKVHRANYLMRGVAVPAGTHSVVFRYEMKPSGFYLVLGCNLAGLGLVGIVAWSAKRKKAAEAAK